jgi:hypothetical protein
MDPALGCCPIGQSPDLHVEAHAPSSVGSKWPPLGLLPIGITGEGRIGGSVDNIQWQLELSGKGEGRYYGVEVSSGSRSGG